jgi:hypothetical protein
MSTPRRRLVRTTAVANSATQQRHRRVQTLRSKLTEDRAALARWMSRLRRAFHTVEKIQLRIARIDRQLAHLEET